LHCYAELLARRWGRKGLPFTAENMKRLTPFLDEPEMKRMRSRSAEGKRVFVGDMTDIFGEWIPEDLLNRLFSEVLEMSDSIQWQILTKRADRMQEYLSWRWGEGRIPKRNIWLGVSVEDQKTADERIPLLLQTPAAVRFVSYEPALAAVDFRRLKMKPGLFLDAMTGAHSAMASSEHIPLPPMLPGLDWLIVGGESGPGAREFEVAWAQYAKRQCSILTKLFIKQMGSFPIVRNDQVADVWYYADGSDMDTETLDGDSYRYQGAPVRLKLKDRKGGDMAEWEESLRVREFPK
jgi:protein gp37